MLLCALCSQLISQIYQSDMFCSHLKMHIQGFPTVAGIYQYWKKQSFIGSCVVYLYRLQTWCERLEPAYLLLYLNIFFFF